MNNEENLNPILVSEAAGLSSEVTIGHIGGGKYAEPKWAGRVAPVTDNEKITFADVDDIIDLKLRYDLVDTMRQRLREKERLYYKNQGTSESRQVLDAMCSFADAVKAETSLRAVAMLSDPRYVDVQNKPPILTGKVNGDLDQKTVCHYNLSKFFDKASQQNGFIGEGVDALIDYIINDPIEKYLEKVNTNLQAFEKKVSDMKRRVYAAEAPALQP